ncbi:hypothetical protein PSm6_44310 [Pseudomonas solani]|uniref:Uncharacterized protein n=1 Tax=Pseudomonas solani TaxID=2731552 RepID=A0ABN6BZT4_9PSED|nr:hypothetical protein [Pseudomonas solani]BCD88024.1 hypothetical protein PSm6_44310 [Pseudomonas solani]
MSDENQQQEDQPKEIEQKELDDAAQRPAGAFDDLLKQIAPTVPPYIGQIPGKL